MRLPKVHVVHLILVLLIVAGMRLPFFDSVVTNWDESLFFVVAKDLAEGGSLYVTAWEPKGPCLFFILAAGIKVFGASVYALRVFTALYVLASVLVVFLLSRRLFGDRGAVAAALYYGVFLSSTSFHGLGSMAEVFMMGPVVLSLLGFAVYLGDEEKRWPLILCGAAAAIAMLTKFASVYSLVMVPLYLLCRQLVHKPVNGRQLGREVLYGVGGFLGALGSVLLYFVFRGTLSELLFVYRYNSQYLNDISAVEAWKALGLVLGWMATREILTMLALAAAVFVAFRWRLWSEARWKGVFFAGLVLTSLLGVSLGRNTFFHYYLQMSLGFALVVGFAVSQLEIKAADWSRFASAGLILMVLSTYSPYRFESVARHLESEPGQDLGEVAEYLQENTDPEDTIFVLGGEPILYLMADRQAPTRYFFWLYHWGRWAEVFRDEGLQPEQFLTTLPNWFVFHQRGDYERIPHLENLMYSRYELTTVVGEYQIAKLVAPSPTN
ncbi:MAG: hypothetical protein GY906_28690 [bacterium]|nr:hypothetical protein [bacterium]